MWVVFWLFAHRRMVVGPRMEIRIEDSNIRKMKMPKRKQFAIDLYTAPGNLDRHYTLMILGVFPHLSGEGC